MINLNLTPQRSDLKINYIIDNDVLTVIVDEIEEVFDFTDFPEGTAEEIFTDILPINPIIHVEKFGEDINVEAIKFYSLDEKHLYEEV
jgi:hypothetical protein